MELKLNISYRELLALIRQLPGKEIRKLKAELALIASEQDDERDTSAFQDFILKGPVISDEQYQEYLANRQHFNA